MKGWICLVGLLACDRQVHIRGEKPLGLQEKRGLSEPAPCYEQLFEHEEVVEWVLPGACAWPVGACRHVERRSDPVASGRVTCIDYQMALLEFESPPDAPRPYVSRAFVTTSDIIPTPRGRAWVYSVRRDGVTLHYFHPNATEAPYLFHVMAGASSKLGSTTFTVLEAWSGEARVALGDDASDVHVVSEGDVLATSEGSFAVVDVVDGKWPGPLGWVTLDTR